MTFLELQQAVYDRTGAIQAPDAAVVRRVKRFLNRWNRKVLTAPGMDPLRRGIVPFSSVANQQTYGLAVQSVKFIVEASTQRRLHEKTLGWYRERFPDPARVTGTPLYYVPMGFARIHTRPSAASTMFVVSSQAADVGNVTIQAIRANGYTARVTVALTGTTPKSFGLTDVVDVNDFFLTAAQTGLVTLTQGSGGTELSRINVGDLVTQFYRLALAPTPPGVIVYSADVINRLANMTIDTDQPFENEDFHDIVEDGAVSDELEKNGKMTDARELRAGIAERIKTLRGAIMEWPEGDADIPRSFEETIKLPVL